jgi:formate hydrogenlyase subunit 3/multisubunit Na+/H+ antiporter MnhD subunit
VVALLSAWLAARLPTGIVLELLGRSIELDRLSQITLSLVFGATAVLFLIPALLPAPSSGLTQLIIYGKDKVKRKKAETFLGIKGREGRAFYPVGLAVLGLCVAASLSRHMGIVAILLEIAVILTVFIIQGARLESTRAALRFLILMSLATPLFLLAAWRIDFFQLSGGLEATGGVELTILLLGFGFAVWLGIVPFHGWITSTAAESSPVTAAFVLITFPTVAFSTLLHLLADFPWLVGTPQLVGAVLTVGVVTALVGGLLASVQRGFSELLGYAALYDLGCLLTLVGLGGPSAVITILVSLTARVLALTLIAASVSAIRLRVSSDGFAQLSQMVQHMPVATVGLILGGLTLAGAPFTAGFATHWQLLRSLAEADARGVVLVALAGLGVATGYLRGFRATLLSNGTQNNKMVPAEGGVTFTLQEPPGLFILISLLIVLTILLGLFPAILIEPLQRLAIGISIPIE